MIGAIEVEIVGDGGWVGTLVTIAQIAGPVLIAGAAVFAARAARDSAFERQREQLAHDTGRQEEALEHDREMRDRESTRLVIDRAMETVYEIVGFFSDWKVEITWIQKVIDDPEKTEVAKERAQQATIHLREATSTFAELGFSSVRLRSRPDMGQLPEAYDAVRKQSTTYQRKLAVGVTEKLTDEQREEIEKLDGEMSEKVATALLAWRSWLED